MQRRRRRVLEHVELARHRVAHDPSLVDDRRVLRCGERDLDHLDLPTRQVLVELRRRQCRGRHRRRQIHAAGQRRRRPRGRGAADVDVEVGVVVRALQDRVGMRAAARLHGGHLHRVCQVRDVEDAHALESRADRRVRRRSPPAARVSSTDMKSRFPYTETSPCPPGQTTAVASRRVRRVGDVVDLEAVEVADEGEVALEGEVRVDEAEVTRIRRVEEAGGLHPVREQLDAVRGDPGVRRTRSSGWRAGRWSTARLPTR